MDKTISSWIPVALTTVCCLAGSSCGTSTLARRNVIVLVDYSSSIPAQELHRYAATIVDHVLGSLSEHDALEVYPIDAAAAARDARIVGIDLGERQFAQPGDGVTHRQDSIRSRLRTFLGSIADSMTRVIETGRNQRLRFAGRTDILGALEQVSHHLERSHHVGRWSAIWNAVTGETTTTVTNVILICSDMINESEDADFQAQPPNGDQTRDLIARLRNAGRLPDFSGTVVFVVGRTGRDAHQVDAIGAFWARYFRETGADLRSYDFDAGSSLTQFLRGR